MTQTAQSNRSTAAWKRRRRAWLQRLRELVDQLAAWARAEGWKVTETTKSVPDRGHGDFDAPHLLIELPKGELHVNPVALFPPEFRLL